MRAAVSWVPSLVREIPNQQYNTLREDRVGVMLHYDGSRTDEGAASWFEHPDCRVSYHWLVLDDGGYVSIAPPERRAWHAGVCRPSDVRLKYADANSAFYGIAAATDGGHDVTPLQLLTIAWLTRRCFDREGWSTTEAWRIVGHSSEAWPRGRKVDPEGTSASNPIFSPADVRQLLGRVRL